MIRIESRIGKIEKKLNIQKKEYNIIIAEYGNGDLPQPYSYRNENGTFNISFVRG
jgi:hypothetical protein